MRQGFAVLAAVGLVAGCHKDAPAPEPLDPTNVTVQGTFRLFACSNSGATLTSPPCGYRGSPSNSYWTDSARIQLNSDRSVSWTMWQSSWALRCTNPSDPNCKIADTTLGVATTSSGTYVVASESVLTVNLPIGQLFPNNFAAGLTFRPVVTLANQATWKADTISSPTFGQFTGGNLYKRAP